MRKSREDAYLTKRESKAVTGMADRSKNENRRVKHPMRNSEIPVLPLAGKVIAMSASSQVKYSLFHKSVPQIHTPQLFAYGSGIHLPVSFV